MHISSTIQGILRKGVDAFDALRAAFPAGTLSGAPKIRAMTIIDGLENSRRGLYGGAICAIDSEGNLDSCIAIRMATIKDGVATVRAGAGVVYDSDPQKEADETRHKARAILEGIILAGGEKHMILIIDNYDSFTYNLYQFIAQRLDDVQVVRNDKITIDEMKKLKPKGIVLSPGPGKPENAGICVELVKVLLGEVPILGVCLGHQAIAAAFGGNIIHAEEIVHGKKTVVFHNRSGIYKDVPLPFEAARYHSLMVDRHTLPPVLKVEAENGEGMLMGI